MLSVVIVLGALVHVDAVTLVASLLLTHKVLGRATPRSIAESPFLHAVVTCVMYVTILQIVIVAVWPFARNFPLDRAIGLTGGLLVIASVILSVCGSASSAPRGEAWRVNVREDAWAVLVALILCAVTIGGPLYHSATGPKPFDPSVAIDFVDTGLDDSSHLSRVNDRLQLNRGVLLDTDMTEFVVQGGTVSTYPPSWHAANASLMRAVWPGLEVGGESAIAYVASKLFWLFVLGFLFARFTVMAAQRITVGRASHIPLWLMGAATFFAYYALLEQFREGFYSFMPALLGLLVCAMFLIQLDSSKRDHQALVPAILAVAGVALSWILSLPALGLVLAGAFVHGASIHDVRVNIRQTLRALAMYAPIVVVTVIALLVQLHLLTTGTSRSFSEGINDPGAITIHSSAYFIFIAAGLFLHFSLRDSSTPPLTRVYSLLAGLLGTTTVLYVFQVLTIGRVEYYTLKNLNTFIIIGLPIAIVGWQAWIEKVSGDAKPVHRVSISCLMVFALPVAIGLNAPNSPNTPYVKGEREFSVAERQFMYESMTSRSAIPFRERSADVIFYTPGRVGPNIVASNILRSIQKVDDCDDKIFSSLLNDDGAGIFDSVRTCRDPGGPPLTIVTRRAHVKELTALVRKQQLVGEIDVVGVG